MKRKNLLSLLLLVSLMTAVSPLHAQYKNRITPFRKGSVTVNPGFGLGMDYKDDVSGGAVFGTKAALELGIWKAGPGVVSLGIEAGVTLSDKSSISYYQDYRSYTFIIASRSAWHYGWKVPGLDTYGGLSAGIGFHHYDYNGDHHYNADEVIPVIGIFAGASYFFSRSFGVNAEAGMDITSFQGGIIFKLR